MTKLVKRDELVKCLAMVNAGLSVKDIIEQSSCFVFRGGTVRTFNDDVACTMKLPSAMEAMECVVPAAEFRSLLTKLDDENFEVALVSSESGVDAQLVLKTKCRSAGIRVRLRDRLPPLDYVGAPKTWSKIPAEFVEAVETVQGCADRGYVRLVLGCVCLTPNGIEAIDGYQAIRYQLKTGLEEPVLVRRDDLVKIAKLEVEEWGAMEGWLHFRNSAGLVVSCRRWNEKFPDLSTFFELEGEETILPKTLVEAVNKVEVFVDSNDVVGVTIDLNSSRLLLRGEGPLGWYEERQKTNYVGGPLRFHIASRLLREVCSRSEQCVIGHNKLLVKGERFMYVSCLLLEQAEKAAEKDE